MLPPPVEGTGFTVRSAGAEVQVIRAGEGPPMLLVHSVNAAACGFEMRPLFEHYRRSHTVFCMDLPGFGRSERSDRDYHPGLMVQAVCDVLDAIGAQHPGEPVALMGLSLGCEYVAAAALQQPGRVGHLALVSPTGLATGWPEGQPGQEHLGRPWLLRTLRSGAGRALFRGLTTPSIIRLFLRKTWGSRDIDEGLFAYDVQTVRMPGAEHAPLHFISGYLFTARIEAIYGQLTLPVWVCHGTRGDFTNYQRLPKFAARPNWRVTVLPTGALPQFEAIQAMTAGWDAARAESA